MDSQRGGAAANQFGEGGRSNSDNNAAPPPLIHHSSAGSLAHLGASGAAAGATQLTMPVSQMNTQQTNSGTNCWVDTTVWGALISTDSHHGLGSRYRLKTASATIGRSTTSTVHIDDDRVSGTHCKIFPGSANNNFSTPSRAPKSNGGASGGGAATVSSTTHDGPYVQDNSLNGTFVNQKRVPKGKTCRIISGDEVSIVLIRSKRKKVDDNDAISETRDYLITFIFQDFSAPRPPQSSFLQQGGLGHFTAAHNNSSLLRSPSSILVGGGGGGGGATNAVGNNPNNSGYGGSDSQQPLFPSQSRFPDSLNNSGVTGAGAAAAAGKKKELPHIDWQWGNLIGRGAASDVYVGIDISNGQMIAIKRLHKTKEQQQRIRNRKTTTNGDDEDVSPTTMQPMNASLCISTIGGGNNNTLTGGAMGLADVNKSVMFESMSLTGQSIGIGGGGGGTGDISSFIAADIEEDDGEDTPTLAKRNSSANAKGWVVTADVEAELGLLQSLSNRRIVKYLGFAVDDSDHVCILLEYVSGGSLQALISNFGSFLEPIVRIYALQILQGLEYLHSNHVVHGDIKPANILLNDRGHVKLSDFGTSQIVASTKAGAKGGGGGGGDSQQKGDSQHQQQQPEGPSVELTGTPLWMSPEMIRRQVATFQSDIWAFGCAVLEMATGAQPWSECSFTSPIAAVFQIAQTTTGPSLEKLKEVEASPELLSFLQATLTINAYDRPSAMDLLSHPFILGGGASSPTAPSGPAISVAAVPINQNGENAMHVLGQPQETTNSMIGANSSNGNSPTNTAVVPPTPFVGGNNGSAGGGIGFDSSSPQQDNGSGNNQRKPVLAEHIEYVRSVSNHALNPNATAGVGGPVPAVQRGTTAGGLSLGGLTSGLTAKLKGL